MSTEQRAYSSFVRNVESLGAEVLNQRTFPFWIAYFREIGSQETKFVRKSDGTIWLSAPLGSHGELEVHAGDPRSSVVDAGSMTFVGEEEIDVIVWDESGKLNIGKDAQERAHTVFVVSHLLGELVRLVGSR